MYVRKLQPELPEDKLNQALSTCELTNELNGGVRANEFRYEDFIGLSYTAR
jgi:hypothetical protein